MYLDKIVDEEERKVENCKNRMGEKRVRAIKLKIQMEKLFFILSLMEETRPHGVQLNISRIYKGK